MRVAGGPRSVPVEGQLARWLARFDAHGAALSPSQAAQWVVVWRQEEAVGARSQLPRRLRGPGVARERPSNHFLVGRALFRTNTIAGTLRDDLGRLRSSTASVEAALWESRRDVWGSVPNLPFHC